MRKEIIFAIVAGSLAGILIAFGVWRANIALKPKVNEQLEIARESLDKQAFGLTLAKPNDNSVVTSSSTLVSGITSPQAWVIISNDEEDLITKSSEDGTFEVEIDLSGGLSELLVTAFNAEGKASQDSVSVVYSTEFKKHLPESINLQESDATSEADIIREKVKEKIEVAKKSPVFYQGSVTDISELTLQVKAQAGEIKQISVSDDTEFINSIKTNQSVDFEDIAIGDFIISMGFINGNEVLDGKRILVTTQPQGSNLSVVYGTISSIDGKEVVIATTKGDQITLKFPKAWKGPNINKLEAGEKLIAIGNFDDELLVIRTIEVISQETASPSPSIAPKTSPEAEEIE